MPYFYLLLSKINRLVFINKTIIMIIGLLMNNMVTFEKNK